MYFQFCNNSHRFQAKKKFILYLQASNKNICIRITIFFFYFEKPLDKRLKKSFIVFNNKMTYLIYLYILIVLIYFNKSYHFDKTIFQFTGVLNLFMIQVLWIQASLVLFIKKNNWNMIPLTLSCIPFTGN